MSFSFDVKEELCKVQEKDNICKAAELYGMVLFGQTVEENQLKVSTENVLVINHLQSITADLLGLFFEMNEIGVTFNATLQNPNLAKLYQTLRMNEDRGVSLEVKSHLVHSKDRFFAFLRGAVLVGGYFSDPFSGYHFELVTPYYTVAKSLLELMNNQGISCKMVVRRSNHVIYIKDSQQIYDLLYRLGARSSAFELMNVKIEKE
ncbi:MAG: DNA-binding protein WhiA, partial [Clostridia bacterium]|nr:DNA-binding protein WhiA [Clostridia bacterium]